MKFVLRLRSVPGQGRSSVGLVDEGICPSQMSGDSWCETFAFPIETEVEQEESEADGVNQIRIGHVTSEIG